MKEQIMCAHVPSTPVKKGREYIKNAAVLQGKGNFNGFSKHLQTKLTQGKWERNCHLHHVVSFSASSVWIMIIGLDLFCVSDDHAASGFTTLFSGEDGRITTDAPSWSREGCLVRSPRQTSLVFTKTVSDSNSSRLGRGRPRAPINPPQIYSIM